MFCLEFADLFIDENGHKRDEADNATSASAAEDSLPEQLISKSVVNPSFDLPEDLWDVEL